MKLILVVVALSLTIATTACSESKKVPAPSNGAAPAAAADANGGDAAEEKTFRASVVASGIFSERNSCELLTQADAEAAVGQTLKKNALNQTLGICDYNALDFSAGASLTVGDWESTKNMAVAGSHQPRSISGVGDEALWLEVEGKLYVRKGNEGFMLGLHGPKIDPLPDKGLPAYKELALRVVAHF